MCVCLQACWCVTLDEPVKEVWFMQEIHSTCAQSYSTFIRAQMKRCISVWGFFKKGKLVYMENSASVWQICSRWWVFKKLIRSICSCLGNKSLLLCSKVTFPIHVGLSLGLPPAPLTPAQPGISQRGIPLPQHLLKKLFTGTEREKESDQGQLARALQEFSERMWRS